MKLYDENLKQTWSETDSFTEERYLQFSNYIKEGNNILDIGCNTGRGGMILNEKFDSVNIYGVELIKERIEKIPKGIYADVYNESIITSTCNNIKFDVIVAGEVIEHIPSDLFIDMLHNCKKLLSDNGIILFTTPNPNSLLVKLGRRAVFNDPSHVNIMAISDFKKIVLSCGLDVKSIKGSGKISRYLGFSFPMFFYGSYLAVLQQK